MSYNRENYRKIRAEFVAKPLRAQQVAEERRAELHARVQGVAELDRALAETGLAVLAAAAEGSEGLDGRIASLQEKNRALREQRTALLAAAGYPADYSDLHYDCPVCSDTGYVGGRICDCMKRALTLAGYESSGVGGLIARQSFDNFSLDFYTGADRETMAFALDRVRGYAGRFEPGRADSLLFVGGTGLGKTHLSTAAAKVIIDRGYDVVYDTAQNIFSDFETERFRSRGEGDVPDTAKYFECDLLILDDLGTEVSTTFTVACLYNIINTRQNRQLPMIISTNLDRDGLRRRYADRITSRLFGEFYPLVFVGGDVRAEKLKREI